MLGSLHKRPVTLKTGQEQLTFENQTIGTNLGQFWQCSVSDIISNATRGRFAEFIVATALGIDTSNPRDEWAPFDLVSPEGINIEVKSASYLQSWDQSELSKVKFSIKLSRQWEAASNRYANDSTRPSDVYVFCLLSHIDKQTLNPLNLDQ